MHMQVTCPACGAGFRTRAANAGRQTKCSRCGAILEIPRAPTPLAADQAGVPSPPIPPPLPTATGIGSAAPVEGGPPRHPGRPPQGATSAANAPPPCREELIREILGGFQGRLEPIRLPGRYRLGIALVALVMVLLPLVYVALIGLVGYGTWFHATHNTALFKEKPFGRHAVLVYFGPVVAGIIAMFFMVKPLLARPARTSATRSVSPNDEPLLFAFVERVGAAVGAPRPRRIDVNCEVNASASFRHGIWSMFGSDLVLTIGLPLAAGLNLRQFAGVLAHELGHFTQGAGMRMSYLVRAISWWLTRVVYERDTWDERLARWSRSGDYQIMLVLWLARFCVWLTRRVLWVLMVIGHAVAGFLLRQMEFHADLHEARLAGCDTFEQTMRKMSVLSVAHLWAMSDLTEFFKEGRLGDNLPRLILANVDQMPAEFHAMMDEGHQQSKTGWFDTHPSPRDRIAAVQRDGAAGVFRLEHPATVLFANFDTLARQVTEDYYREELGPQFDPAAMQPAAILLARQAQERNAVKAAGRYFQGHLYYARALPLGADAATPAASPDGVAAALKSARQQMLDAEPGYRQAIQAFRELDGDAFDAEVAAAILRAGAKPRADQFRQPMQNADQVWEVKQRAAQAHSALEAQLKPFETAAQQRLSAALQLACVPKVASRLPAGPDVAAHVARILPALDLVAGQSGKMLTLRNAKGALDALVDLLQAGRKGQTFIKAMVDQLGRVHACLGEIQQALAAAPYPFEHAKGPCSLADYLLPNLPDSENVRAVLQAAGDTLRTTRRLFLRMMGELALVAEQVETLLGLPRLPDPPEKLAI